MRIHCFNLEIIWENKSANMELVSSNLEKADIKPGELLVFPELTLTGFTMNSEVIAENISNSATINFFEGITNRYNCSVLFGMAVKHSESIFNSAIYLDAQDRKLSQYNKIHTFSLAQENNHYSRGNSVKIVRHNEARIGLSICYDLRFSHLFNAHRGIADIFINIANWPDVRQEHWHSLGKARAIEFQSYFVGVNRLGMDPQGNSYSVGTTVFDPFGKLVESSSETGFICTYDIDLSTVQYSRDQMACITDYNGLKI